MKGGGRERKGGREGGGREREGGRERGRKRDEGMERWSEEERGREG